MDQNGAPFRSQFDPSQLKPLLSQMMMITDGRLDYRFRLSGGFLNTLFAKNLKDETLLSLFSPSFHQAVIMALEGALALEQVLIVKGLILMRQGQTTPPQADMALEICLCPLKNVEGQSDRFIGIIQPNTIAFSELKGPLGPMRLKSASLYSPNQQWRPAHLNLVINHQVQIQSY